MLKPPLQLGVVSNGRVIRTPQLAASGRVIPTTNSSRAPTGGQIARRCRAEADKSSDAGTIHRWTRASCRRTGLAQLNAADAPLHSAGPLSYRHARVEQAGSAA